MAKLWVMFFTSLLLVSAMNFYAVIREPDLIEIDEIHEYPRESVKIKGVLTSFVVDPYGEQADRIDLQVREVDGHSVVEVRWFVDRDNEIPPIGTIITVEGEVTEWNGRIWLSSNGYGAIVCADSDCDSVEYTAMQLVEVAMNPQNFANMSVKVDGYLSESLEPDTLTYLGQGDLDSTSGAGNDIRFDFASMGILPDGGSFIAYHDSTDPDPLFGLELLLPTEYGPSIAI